MNLFDRIMCAMPKIMTGVAVLFYIGSVLTALVTGQEMSILVQDDPSVAFKARAVLLLFVQPMIPALLLMFGAALLWRFDLWLDRNSEGGAE